MSIPPLGTCSRCGASYRVSLEPYATQGPNLCDVCEIDELLAGRPTPEEDEAAHLRSALDPSRLDGAAAELDSHIMRLGQPSAPVRALLGIPPNVHLAVRFYWGDGFVDVRDARRWATFRAELLHCAPEALGRPHPWIEPIYPQPEPQALIRWRVWRVDAPGVLQVWFDAGTQRERRRADDLDSVGLGALDAFLAATRDERLRGRPMGSVMMSCSQFHAKLSSAYQTCESRHGRRPTTLEVAAEIPLPVDTLRAYCRRCHVTWATYRPE